MATIVLSAVGSAVGSAIGGSFLGLGTAVIGRAIGATIGRVIDQQLMGQGSEVVETGQVDRFRLTGASEGAPISQVFGRNRVGGHVIWATRFKETVSVSGGGGGGKGGGRPAEPEVREYSYSTSLAIALCEGEISRLGRIWADGIEIAAPDLNMRVYKGSDSQLPDPKIEAVEGAGNVPAYRGIAYVVIEDLQLGRFGNRVPQFSFEIVRPVDLAYQPPEGKSLSDIIRAVALIPGTGEYGLATTPIHYDFGQGTTRTANVHSASGKTDFATSLDTMTAELPRCGSTSLVVCWFGDDLRIGDCDLKPKVEQTDRDGTGMAWRVSGQDRSGAEIVPKVDGRSVYGGTPADAAIVESITAMNAAGQKVMFYPFILMEQLEGNTLTDPYTGAPGQAVLPWRGRITTSLAPGVAGSTDGTAAADAEVANFLGFAQPGDFVPAGDTVVYNGPAEWSYRRFILHYAHLCALAGGVDAFCLGSEMRGATQIRGAAGFPFVAALKQLAGEVRAILGPSVKISYAADWSEYFGYQPQDGSGDLFFNLDPLWADPNVDFIGIDNYMPISDWRDGADHADADAQAIYNLDYLQANIAGGEGFDWYYADPQARDAQVRSPITDGAYGEPWVFRYKDLAGWWTNHHFERLGGIRQSTHTGWQPQSKPIWFTELGCAAIDKATNQPNKFLDPKSSESALPHYSSGTRDDLIQAQYLRAFALHFDQPANNPVSGVYGGPMVDMERAHVWAWDARPFPAFPNRSDVWTDGGNYSRGHWLNGRVSAESLAAVATEVCARSGVTDLDVSRLYGLVRGYGIQDVQSARASLQPLMLAYGFDTLERGGQLRMQTRLGLPVETLNRDALAVTADIDGDIETMRSPAAETAGKVRLNFLETDGDYESRSAEAIFPDEVSRSVATSEVPLVLLQSEGQAVVERWLAEARVARDSAKFALPPSKLYLGAGDVVEVDEAGGPALYRIDRVEQGISQIVEAVRVEPQIRASSDDVVDSLPGRTFAGPSFAPVYPLFMDLPLLTGEETAHAPHIAVSADPWPGPVAVYSAPQDAGYTLNTITNLRATIGRLLDPLPYAPPSRWDRGPAVRVQMASGSLLSASQLDVLNGANVLALGDGSASNWEILQFAEAELVAPDVYALSMRLRGQAGTDGLVPQVWPAGSELVLLDGTPRQISLALSARGLARHYRIGPANQPVDHSSYVARVEAFDGIGLRPYAPVHLALSAGPGDRLLTWVRRTRIDGDSWASVEVPLGEDSESYVVMVLRNGITLRSEIVSAPAWTYTAAAQAQDGPGVELRVAQLSDRFGPGLFGRIVIDD